jgi:hypothetical protein
MPTKICETMEWSRPFWGLSCFGAHLRFGAFLASSGCKGLPSWHAVPAACGWKNPRGTGAPRYKNQCGRYLIADAPFALARFQPPTHRYFFRRFFSARRNTANPSRQESGSTVDR